MHNLPHENVPPQPPEEDRAPSGNAWADEVSTHIQPDSVDEISGMLDNLSTRGHDREKETNDEGAPIFERSQSSTPIRELQTGEELSTPSDIKVDKGKDRMVDRLSAHSEHTPLDQSLGELNLSPTNTGNGPTANDQERITRSAPILPSRRVKTTESTTSITHRQFLNHATPLSEVAYLMKSITFNGERRPIVCQTSNGACPILSIANFLSLVSGIELPRNQNEISAVRLTEILADYLLDHDRDLSFLEALEGLHRGLNVDPQFTGVDHFMEGQELMREFGCELVHGWLPSADSPEYRYLAGVDTETSDIVRTPEKKFNNFEAAQLQVLIEPDAPESLVLSDFFTGYPTNMTPTGLRALQNHLKEGEMSVLFYNSHFSLLYKYPVSHELYTLVTDSGYIDSGDDVVWESLEVNDASQFYSADFIPRVILGESRVEDAYGLRPKQHDLMEHDEDAMLARQMHARENGHLQETDAAFAREIQAEEDAAMDRRRKEEARLRAHQDDQRRIAEYNGPEYAAPRKIVHSRGKLPRRIDDNFSNLEADHEATNEKRKKDCLMM